MIGVNVYGLLYEIQTDLTGTFRQIAAAGFDEVELLALPQKEQGEAPLAMAAEETMPRMIDQAKQCSLTVNSVHVLCIMENDIPPVKTVADTIRRLKHQFGIENYVFSGMYDNTAGAEKWAAYLRELAATTKSDGCRIVYHNHSQEFTPVAADGNRPTALDHFFASAGRDVWLQLDIGWAGIAGNECEIAEKYAERIVCLHLKDFVPGTKGKYYHQNMPDERFCAIGSGEIQTAQILELRHAFPNFMGSIIIDQDHSSTNMLDDIRLGQQNLCAMLRKGGKGSGNTAAEPHDFPYGC